MRDTAAMEQAPPSAAEDPVWDELLDMAAAACCKEPALASLLNDVILTRASLEDALAKRLSRKLAYHSTPESFLEKVMQDAFAAAPEIRRAVRVDMAAIKERDPAARGMLSPFLYYKGFHALTCHRIGHHLWNNAREELALYLQSLVSEVFSVDIHPAAKFGSGILLDHADGFVAGETAVVEDDVSILHEVTLGGTGKTRGDRHPKVRQGVLIGAGAKVVGRCKEAHPARGMDQRWDAGI